MPKDLSQSPISNKLYITFFLIIMAYAFYVSCANFYERTSFSPRNTVRHYSGNEEKLNDESSYEYNENLLQEGFFFPKSYREIIEITHVHAFTISLIIFVMSRILSMTLIRDWIKITIYSVGFVGTIMNLSGPWLIRFKSDVFSLSLITSYFLLGFCFIFLITLPLYEMWFKSRELEI
ncbi:MAG: hypothetical protein JYX80_11595 [Candidatus Scalindua sediminis]|nr:hypothetical protein [Candidatus Scalindua sediminis]